MNESRILKKKAVISSLFLVLLICSASTFVSAINGSKEIDAFDNRTKTLALMENIHDKICCNELQKQRDASYEEIFSSLKQELIKEKRKVALNLLCSRDDETKEDFYDKWCTISEIIFKYILDITDQLDLTPKRYATIRNKINLFHDRIQKVLSKDTTITEESLSSMELFFEERRTILHANHNEKTYYPSNIFESEYFEDYWAYYLDLRNKIAPYDNYEDWYWWSQDQIWDDLAKETAFLLFVALLVATAGNIIPGASWLAFIVTTAALSKYVKFLIDVMLVRDLYDWLWTREIDIVLYVMDQQGNGVDNLTIWAINSDVPSEYEYLFNFRVNNAYDIQEEGWYALSSRDWLNRTQPPCPPGFWEISIPAQEANNKLYDGLDKFRTYEIQDAGIYINDSVVLIECTGYPNITNPSPEDAGIGIGLNPTLCVNVSDDEEDYPLTIIFKTNASGEWDKIGESQYGESGIYCTSTTNMDNYNTTYYWNVTAIDSEKNEITKTYHFTTTKPKD